MLTVSVALDSTLFVQASSLYQPSNLYPLESLATALISIEPVYFTLAVTYVPEAIPGIVTVPPVPYSLMLFVDAYASTLNSLVLYFAK